ncbi:hypothetical protein D9758_008894 [Tetrapyrgos nigripes]|uniref:Uncharacterized protein n=1 Tax=Tetrapyrgos nigripes TaxID=182062 RepID=A0A8H5FPP9_9AGAR|nr:hypothetical protein D9758_008894 [Tetrapyrgos nigripes]
MEPTTAKFQSTLPHAFFSVSSNLAALHGTRVHTSDACARCGSLLFYGGSTTRIVRKPNKSRCRQSKCDTCEWMNEQSIQPGNESLFSNRNRRAATKQTHLSLSAVKPPEPSVQQSSLKPKSRPKKKVGLQEMLARNRLREEKEKQTIQKSSSLAAFLGGL